MIRLLKVLGWTLGAILILVVLLVAAVFVGLNTGAGRQLAAREINRFLPDVVHVEGIGGHFPADIKLAHAQVLDRDGAYVTADGLELRWLPWALWHRTVHVTSLTAAHVSVLRAPVPAEPAQKSSGGGLPKGRLIVDRLAVARLSVAPALAGGQALALGVTGRADATDLTHLSADVAAVDAGGRGDYRVHAALDDKRLDLALHVAEPPDGLLGHFAGPQVRAPLALDVALDGPRGDAALKFDAALGAARLFGGGTLGLAPDDPHADVTLTVPSLADAAAFAHQDLAGATQLRLTAARQGADTKITLSGTVALQRAPGPATRLVGEHGALDVAVLLGQQRVAIQTLTVTGAGFALSGHGTIRQGDKPIGLDLATTVRLSDVAAISPALAGGVAVDATVQGDAQDFAANAVVTGAVRQKAIPSGPFTLTVAAQHLPRAPTGTLTGSGQLEGATLALDAAFTRDTAGDATVKIASATWRSLSAQADLALAAGQQLPTGTAKLAIARLADFQKFVPTPVGGSVTADFAHAGAQNFALHVNAAHVTVSPGIGAIDAKLAAQGPETALAVTLQANVAKLAGYGAEVATAATLNLRDRSATVSRLTAAWHGLDAVLQGPAAITTKPGIAVRHLALALNGAAIALDGTLTPRLDARLSIAHLPAKLAGIFAPSLQASGMLNATADIQGTAQDPSGTVSLNASGIGIASGPAAALPPASLDATARLANRSADLQARISAGQNLTLAAAGTVPLTSTGPIDLHLTGSLDLRIADAVLAANGTTIRGVITPNVTVTGTAAAPRADGTVILANGSVQNIGSGLSLTHISATVAAADRLITLQTLNATAGPGNISGHGSIDIGDPALPIDLGIAAANAELVASDLVTEKLNAALTIKGALKQHSALGGRVDILSANINIPKSLPPSVANLPILNRGEPPPPPAPPAPPIALDLLLHAANQIFIRGDGLFAELGGRLMITGTAANPDPEGGFTLIRGYYSLGGKTLQFTKGTVSFNGAGFTPTLDLEASNTDSTTTSTLVISGTAAKPVITLTSTPPLPSDEILAHLLFGQGTQNLSAFQAAQLAAALASLAGIGGGSSPLDSVRNALGLDQLSIGGSGGSPTLQAGRYVAPGVYVGAQQSATGQGTQATVQINLYKGLKLNTTAGTSSGTSSTSGSSGTGSSVGLTYQFNY